MRARLKPPPPSQRNRRSWVVGVVLGTLLAGASPLRAQPRLALVHGDDLEGSLTGAGAFAWLSNGDGSFTPCRIGTVGFDHNNIGTEVFGASVTEQTFFVDVDRDGLADIVHVSEDDSSSIRSYRAVENG